MGSGTWTLTGNAATIWAIGTVNNLTFTRGNPIVCNYSGSTGTRSLDAGALSESSVPSFSITAGSDTIGTAIVASFLNLDFTGFSGTWANNTRTIYGDLTLSSGMTLTAGGSVTTLAKTSGTQTITSNGKTIDFPFTINSPGATVQLADNFTMGATRTLGLSAGTLDANNKNLSIGLFSSANSNVRTVTMGSGTWTLTGTGNVFNIGTTTNLTLNANTSNVIVADTSATEKTLALGAGPQLNTVTIQSGSAGVTRFTVGAKITTLSSTGVQNIRFNPTSTYTITNFNVSGSAGNVPIIDSNTAGSAAIFTKPNGVVSTDYISLKDINATGGAYWSAGLNSANVSGNSGWVFDTPAKMQSAFVGIGV